MGHALRSGEQRGGRSRRKSPPQAEPDGRGTPAGNSPRRGLQPPAGRRFGRGFIHRLSLPGAGLLPGAALIFILTGLAFALTRDSASAQLTWSLGLAITGLPVVWRTLRGILARRFAADLVAMLAIITALLLQQPLAGLIVVLMQTGGEALERYAEGRASEAVRELEAAAPRLAHRLLAGEVEDVTADMVQVGDELLLRPGELLSCDAVVVSGRSHVDASRLTGEPVPLTAQAGVKLMSGSLNLEGPLTLRATALASESQYSKIVELVRTAQASKSPLQRLADRYAVWFTPFTLAVSATVYVLSGDPLRVLSVLVVATPCPLILAAPVAVVGGLNRAARHGIIFRHGTALEHLGRITTAIFDKTGTLTIGRPEVARVLATRPWTPAELLRVAAGVEHGSGHLLARTLVQEAERRGIVIPEGREIREWPGEGVEGRVEGRRVTVGGWSFIVRRYPLSEPELHRQRESVSGPGLRAYVAVDGEAAGIVEYADRVRPDLPEFLKQLRRLGVRHLVLLSGDDQTNALAVAQAVGIEEAHGGLMPEEKVAFVQRLVKMGSRVLMVGDGTNDAPALSAATVGIALAGSGGGISAEAADAVILTDDPSRVGDAIAISRRTLRLARQSIVVGLGLSVAAMGFAAFGLIPPVLGAMLQEGIDVMVILNALRASFPPQVSV